MASAEKPLITLPPDVWTEIAPAGFGSLVFQVVGAIPVQFATGATPPTSVDSGIVESRTTPQTIADDDPAAKCFARPEYVGRAAQLRVN